MWKEFKPALRFLGVFVGIYLAGNIIYGLWIASWDGYPDAATRIVSAQTSWILNHLGYSTTSTENGQGPTMFVSNESRIILSIYEGCNGLNVMVVFIAFLVAFGGAGRKMVWFLPLGLVAIHFANLARILLLYFVSISYHHYFYYVHKYVFTAAIYVIVFGLWVVWVAINGKQKKSETA